MCTCISFNANDHYFGRNLDLEYSLGESIVITPRRYALNFRHSPSIQSHYAIIGIGVVADNYPLYYDAVNECGLGVAGLNFPGNAVYHNYKENGENIASFELIPWLLSQCSNLTQACSALKKLRITNDSFNQKYLSSPLHWMVSDRTGSVAVEPLEDGLKITPNAVCVMTNNPPIDFHMNNLCQYLNLTANEPTNRFTDKMELDVFSKGMGGIGLPGDLSSASRYVRAAFTKLNSVACKDNESAVAQFFHILDSVAQTEGCAAVGDRYEKTVYSSCCNTSKGVYYYCTYQNRQLSAVDLNREDLEKSAIIEYPLLTTQNIYQQN